MLLEEIITALSLKLVQGTGSPSQVVFAVTAQDVISEVAKTLGEKSLNMTAEDLMDICHEVHIAFDHDLDARDYIQPGIEVWQIKNI